MNRLKLNIYRKYPNLYAKEIKELVKKHNKELEKFSREEKTELEKLLPIVATEEFFDFIYKKCNPWLSFEDYRLDYDLRKKERIVDLIIRHDPRQVFFAEHDLVKESHIPYVEKYLETKEIDVEVDKVPLIICKSDVVFEKCMKKVASGNYTSEKVIKLLDKFSFDDNKAIKIINKFSDVLNNVNFYNKPYRFETYKGIWNSDVISNFFIEKDERFITYLPNEKKYKLADIIAEKIINGTLENSENILLYNSVPIINAIFYVGINEKYFQYISNSNIESFSKSQLLQLFNYKESKPPSETIKLEWPLGWKKSPTLLHIFLTNYNKSKHYYEFFSFSEEAYSDENVEYIINNNMLGKIELAFPKKFFEDEKFINSYFRKVPYSTFIRNQNVRKNFEKIYKLLKFNNIDEFKKEFTRLNEKANNISYAMLLIEKYKNSGLNDKTLDDICNVELNKIKDELNSKFPNSEAKIDLLLEKIISGERLPFTLEFINSNASLSVATNHVDILSVQSAERIKEEGIYLYDNVNKKHINEIMNLLKIYIEKDSIELFEIAIRMYVTIGYSRSKDLLNTNMDKNYGKINQDTLFKLFSGVSLDVPAVMQGKTLSFEENKTLVNLMFGSNYKDKDTPIYHYLNDFQDKESELQTAIKKINQSEELTEEQKKDKITLENEKYKKYCERVKNFIENFAESFNKWDILEEEFYKSKNKSKIALKLNMAFINENVKNIHDKRTKPRLDAKDLPLEMSDVFEYCGYDTQFTDYPEKAQQRAVDLSRRMDSVQKKKFPNITLSKEGYTIFVYGPNDRNLISAGYRSGCCFRPNGHADNQGQDNSLLNYCVSTEYGGGIEIKNEAGKTIMFSPLLRNGNVLMIHSIETKEEHTETEQKVVHELLCEYASKTIEIAKNSGDDISFVVITDLHHLDNKYTKGVLPVEKKFSVYDKDSKFKDMYTNLECHHMILGNKDDKTFEDIFYGEVDISYDYPTFEYYGIMQFTDAEKTAIDRMNDLKNKITTLANQRYEAKNSGDYEQSNKLLNEIKKLKKEYLSIYKKLLEQKKGIDVFEQHQKSENIVDNINRELGLEIDYNIKEIYSGIDWYIIITPDNKIIANALESGKEKLKKELEALKELRKELLYNNQNEEQKAESFAR